jgi:hypothetical protein
MKFKLGVDAFSGRKTVHGVLARPDGQVLLNGQPVNGENVLSEFLEDVVPEGFEGMVRITAHVAVLRDDQVALRGGE